MQPDPPVAQPSAEVDELYKLITAYNAARADGAFSAALRLIDRAWRLSPDSPEINHLYGQALVAQDPAAALPLLERAVEARRNAIFEAAVIGAIASNNDLDGACDRLANALSRYAVAPDAPLARMARRITRAVEPRYPGWIGIAPNLCLHGEVIPSLSLGPLVLHDKADARPTELALDDLSGDAATFMIAMRRSGRRTMIEVRSGETRLLGGDISFPPDFALDGRATYENGRLTGWVRFGWSVFPSIQILVSGHDGFRRVLDAVPDPLDPTTQSFALDGDLCASGGNRLIISAVLPDGRVARLPDTPLYITPPPRRKAPPVRAAERARRDLTKPSPDRPITDIIIPAYRGVAETLACVNAVIETVSNAEIIVIDDASPDPEMKPALDVLESAGKITLLVNALNCGFPRTVNRGLSLHADRDVVILNSDTEVYGDWLERLRSAAYAESRTGTVTPLTNSGSIASYPKSEDDCSSDEARERDRVARSTNAGAVVDIPTGVGFCLYVRRDCLKETGYFDTVAFAKGYGEENDFCLRAARLGWKHVLAPNIFVRHIGGRSFGTRRKALFERNNRLINLRYPGYDADIQDFIKSDPAHEARRRLDEARLLGLARNHVLLVTLALDGGVRRAVNERAALWRDRGFSPIVLKPDVERPGGCALSIDGAVFDDLAYFPPDELPALANLLERLSIEAIELHHFLGLAPELIEHLFALGPPVDVWVHDYVWYCPRITLLTTRNLYCGEPEARVCDLCVAENGSTLGEPITVAALRDRSARWLADARSVFAPSADLAGRLRAQFAGLSVRIQPLEDEAIPVRDASPPGHVLKIAIIGAIGVQKGYDFLLAAAKDAARRNLPIAFVVIGYTKDDDGLRESGNVFITGQYDDAEVDRLIAREDPNIAFFASVFPETWCYALTHAFRAGLPVAAFDHGAIAERLRARGRNDILFPLSARPDELNDGLLSAFPVLSRPRGSVPALLPARRPGMALIPPIDEFSNDFRSVRTNRPRVEMVQNLNQLTASVEVLPLVKGLYLFSVGATESRRVGDDHELVLPALQVGLGPGTPPDHVELMFGPRTEGAWLCEPRDHIVVKVKSPSTILLLTSIRAQGMPALEIDVKRLDGPQAARPAAAQPRAPEAPVNVPRPEPLALSAQPRTPAQPFANGDLPPVPLRITAHVQRRGDMVFSENQWAGVTGQGLAVESFAILPLNDLAADMIEYKAVTASGVETPWITGGAPCGTRGIAMPLVGFAVRLKPAAADSGYVCEYSAVMVSGATLGPARNGAPCRSVDVGDPIEAIWVSITKSSTLEKMAPDKIASEKLAPDAAPRLLDRPPARPTRTNARENPAPAKASAPPAEAPKPRAPIGPRFSVFRDPVE